MIKPLISIAFVSLAIVSAPALAGDPATGEKLAEACLDCHEGADFKGLSELEIAQKIHANLKGEAKHPAAGNDVLGENVDDIAAYFADEAAKAE
jgi:mono/diheme cytochrome c family protein